MKGKNKLLLNHSEMIRALEHYLNDVQFKERVLVFSISDDKSLNIFEITLSPVEDFGAVGTKSDESDS